MIVLDAHGNLEGRLANLLQWRERIACPPTWLEQRIAELAAELAARRKVA